MGGLPKKDGVMDGVEVMLLIADILLGVIVLRGRVL